MIVIDDKAISDDVAEEQFVCDLHACKGACCTEGDIGAPLDESELQILNDIYEKVKPYLTQEGIREIETQGKYVFVEENKTWNTPLLNKKNGCAWLNYDKHGIAKCGIEHAYEDGVINFRKPISCHLYPIRITKYNGYDAVNYERWHICNAACKNGKTLRVPVFKFLKDALIRKYGEEFYRVLELYVQQKAK